MKIQPLNAWLTAIMFASIAPLATAQTPLGAGGATSDLVLSITQTCQPMSRGGRCSLSFVQTMQGQMPIGDVQQRCAPGWLAHITASRGSVEKGGINRGQAVVCGHAQPEAAIRALLAACDEQTLGICQDANDVDVRWAYWSPDNAQVQALARNQSLSLEQMPQAARCQSPVPIVESSACPPQAAVILRQSGLR
jgi:hypothetical protein